MEREECPGCLEDGHLRDVIVSTTYGAYICPLCLPCRLSPGDQHATFYGMTEWEGQDVLRRQAEFDAKWNRRLAVSNLS